jgi:hypothetical protein
MTGHVFVLRGDLTNLACDAWLVPGDFEPGSTWLPALPDGPKPPLPIGWGRSDGPRSLLWPSALPPPTPQPFLTNTGSGTSDPQFFVDSARAFVRVAAPYVHARGPSHRRQKPLLGVPLVGTGGSGGANVAGDVVRLLLRALFEEVLAHDVDIALVLREGPAWAAAQAERMALEGVAFRALSPAERERAESLAALARAGHLVVFIGAGVSQAAGLPSWSALLTDLAADKTRPEERPALERLNELDRAALIKRRLGPNAQLGNAVADYMRARAARSALGHGLLAQLPVEELITTNYDDLFERASLAAGHPITVLPGTQAEAGTRWILKMHGCVTRPESIVLTREDYMKFQENRSALAGIVQALLLTRHMLFVGFSFTDDNFHRIAHAVRQAMGSANRAQQFGSTLVVNPNPLARELWDDDLGWISFETDASGGPRDVAAQARQADIFLDRVGAGASSTTSHLGDRRYDAVLTPAERELRSRLETLVTSSSEAARDTVAWREVARMLRRLGWPRQS